MRLTLKGVLTCHPCMRVEGRVVANSSNSLLLIIQAQSPNRKLELESKVPPLSTNPQLMKLPSEALSTTIGESKRIDFITCTPILASREVIKWSPPGPNKFLTPNRVP